MAEWSMAVVLKTIEPERVPGVRIPLPPPYLYSAIFNLSSAISRVVSMPPSSSRARRRASTPRASESALCVEAPRSTRRLLFRTLEIVQVIDLPGR